MRKYLIAAAVAAGSVGTANAAPAPSIVFTQGVYTVPSFTTAAIFERFTGTGTAPVGGQQFGTGTSTGSGTFAETATGTTRVFPGSQNAVGTAVSIDGSNDNYLAIGANGSAGTFDLNFGATPMQYFSFALGSLDSYNSVQIFFSDMTSQIFTGLGIIGGVNTVDGTPATSFGQSGRTNFSANGGPGFTRVVFSSSQASFEIDDIAAAVPEPATWALMILGFGMVGSALRFRRRKTTVSFA